MNTENTLSKVIQTDKVAMARIINETCVFLTIFSGSGCDEGAYFPAQDVSFYGRHSVVALRDFCNETLHEVDKLKAKP